ncbi:TauD/TfdA family dioxygenase [Pseudomonas lijiangensis]|uniref:TauD/TfdA family dioxygenase n=1 Tax=Pseudomonas lijiangensis TaxID=2995658 RepID=A0ABX8HK47_9PSED|nr:MULTISPECIES: TauD/TfdA family dioxygenase [Pseudomonas syringae group]MBX8498591.1 TauD/TfdA family dioxygenase [Pseudomonas lijiangensis]MBX8503497.1 TauD/TfdA family dioxygenase [Pseudomonas lijiangensis]MBX8544337.1 TauD/TfdA family dioxygenase [Pseudomonas cichorii]MBX8548065.1 TauD/TfdA family dioxygenase [Pseudomonas cichorii]MBX8553183.1 TauD/TfdA family dioxygenase [Pseudomonas cichorii]
MEVSQGSELTLPFIFQAPAAGDTWQAHREQIQQVVEAELPRAGGVLFRGFAFEGEADFEAFASSFGHELLTYDYASTPRTKLNNRVYTSTEYPAHQVIPLHNEQSYSLNWPMKIWFHCVQASPVGGETPIADSREVYRQLDPVIRQRFADKRLMYVRNYGNGLDLPWQQAFNTEDRAQVEQFCKASNIEFEWDEEGELSTRQVCQAVARHPVSGEWVWFNQAHLFHISNLAPAVRETLISIVGEEGVPRNVFYGDGSPIELEALEHVRAVLQRCQVSFPWQAGDVLMLDNMLVAHGRSTFQGARKVVVAMAEPASAS